MHNGVPIRAWIPAKPRAVVVALHGAGGSENMFFETYGAGLGWKEAQKRNWVFLSPRSGGNSIAASLDWLKGTYGVSGLPLFVMGHSMGGGIAANSAGFSPTAVALFAPATAQLSTAMLKTPIFLGVGEQEIAMLASGSRRIGEQLGANPNSVFKTFPNCEHLMIVADALPEAYKFFETTLRNREKPTSEGKI
jgi:pimeloyl-ACP methyl ester carboxylesterase